jgi:hypothetical protein
MTAPVKPVKLEPTSSYIHITSPLDPQTIQQTASNQNIHIQHKGPIGELEGEHIFEVLNNGQAVARDSEGGKYIVVRALEGLKAADGVTNAQIMESRQRAKR